MAKVNGENFNRILEGLNEAAAFVKGEADPATYRVHVPEDVDVRSIRAEMGLTREVFAARFGFPKGTVRDWEQGRRRPEASARVLLKMIERNPGLWRVALTDPQFLRERVAAYRDRKTVVERSLKRLDSGMRFFAADGNEPLHDVTSDRREDVEAQIKTLDELISLYEGPLNAISVS